MGVNAPGMPLEGGAHAPPQAEIALNLRQETVMITKRRTEPYDAAWEQRYQEIHEELRGTIGDVALAVEHIGNTSFPCFITSPVMDVMIGVASMEVADACAQRLEPLDYAAWDEGGGPDQRFLKRTCSDGLVVRAHVVERSGEFWGEQLLFRNFLRENREMAVEYAHLTKQLANEDDPTAKEEFIANIVRRARAVD